MRKGLEFPAVSGLPWRAPKWLRGAPLWLASAPALLFFAIPMVALFLRVSPARFLAQLTGPTVAQAINLSITTTGLTVLLTVVFGTPLAIFLARRKFFWKPLLDTLIDLAMVLPPSVVGIALLITFGRYGLFGGLLTASGLQIVFTPLAVVLAQTFVAAPYYIRAATAALTEVRQEIEDAAAIDGATTMQTLARITLPLVFPSLFAGAVMTWARALGEFGATIIFAGNFPGRTQTIPLAIYIGFEIDLNQALALSAVLLMIAFTILLVVKGILRQRVIGAWPT